MPKIVLTPSRGQAQFIDVSSKADAIRRISRSMKGKYADQAIQHILDEWLKGSMRTPLLLTDGNEKLQITYIP